jgi:hypothetical protein
MQEMPLSHKIKWNENMEDLFSRFVFFLIAASIGLIIGSLILFIRKQRNKRNMPNEEQKQEAFNLIKQWKVLGYEYSKRIELLRQQGYTKDVANVLLGEYESKFGNP